MVRPTSILLWTVAAVAFALACAPNAAQAGTLFGCDTGGTLYQVDPTNGALTPIGEMRDAYGTRIITFGSSLAFDPTGVLWGVDGHTGRVGMIDTSTAQVTPLPVPTGYPGFISGITFDPDTGALYAVCESGNQGFYQIDLTTGAYTLLQTTTLSLAGMTFSGNGALYGVVYGSGELFEIDPDAGFTTVSLGPAIMPGTGQAMVGVPELTVYGDGPGVSLYAKSDMSGVGLATVEIGSPSTWSIVGGLTGYNRIDGMACSVIRSAPSAVPEPSTLALSGGMGLLMLLAGWRRRKRAV